MRHCVGFGLTLPGGSILSSILMSFNWLITECLNTYKTIRTILRNVTVVFEFVNRVIGLSESFDKLTNYAQSTLKNVQFQWWFPNICWGDSLITSSFSYFDALKVGRFVLQVYHMICRDRTNLFTSESFKLCQTLKLYSAFLNFISNFQ